MRYTERMSELVVKKSDFEVPVPSPEVRKFVLLSLGNAENGTYALDIQSVSEVVQIPPGTKIAPLPHVPPFIRGLFNLRGALISVTDLLILLNRASKPYPPSEKSKLVIIHDEGIQTALIVSESSEVVEVEVSQIKSSLLEERNEQGSLFQGQFAYGEQFIAILSSEALIKRSLMKK